MKKRITMGVRSLLETGLKRDEIREYYPLLAQLAVMLDHLRETDPRFAQAINDYKTDQASEK